MSEDLADPLTLAHFLYDNGHPPFFLAKDSVFRIPVVGRMLTHAEQIPVYRRTSQATEAFRSAVDAVHEGLVQSFAARLYQGQTTNFRTPGGGFAPVYVAATECCPADPRA